MTAANERATRSSAHLAPSLAAGGTPGLWRTMHERTPTLLRVAAAMGLLSLPLLLVGLFDEREFNGIGVWVKPWKFMVSSAIHLASLAFFAALLPRAELPRRGLRWLGAVAALTAIFEVAYIGWRAARGEASHFSVATPFAAAMYSLMGVAAVMLSGCSAVLGVWVARARSFPLGRVMQHGVSIGLVLSFVLGTSLGAYLAAQSGHWVGGSASDAGGLPLVGWSRGGGDLRVAHFFGLHAMQFVPLAAWAFSRVLRPKAGLASIWAFAAAYSAFTMFTFAQALGGRPFP